MNASASLPESQDSPDLATEAIRTALRDLRFGAVEITVHEGRIVQIERREKQRFNLPGLPMA